MPTDAPADDDVITTEQEFDAALRELLESAFANDVNPGGSWVFRNGAEVPDWEVQVHKLAKRS